MYKEMNKLQRENSILKNIIYQTLPIARDYANGKNFKMCHLINKSIKEAMLLNMDIEVNQHKGLFASPNKNKYWDFYNETFVDLDRRDNARLIVLDQDNKINKENH